MSKKSLTSILVGASIVSTSIVYGMVCMETSPYATEISNTWQEIGRINNLGADILLYDDGTIKLEYEFLKQQYEFYSNLPEELAADKRNEVYSKRSLTGIGVGLIPYIYGMFRTIIKKEKN